MALGLAWLADGALQLQPFMFGRAFVTTVIAPNAVGKPAFVAAPVTLAAHLIEPRVVLFNSFAAALQLLIGLGLLYRPTVRPALLASFAWALGVWWIGEGLGGLATGTASPLTGAPGPALLYVLAGVLLWPHGPLRRRGVRRVWALLWISLAALWLLPANRTGDAVRTAIASAPSGARWLTAVQASVAAAATGRGLPIAVVAAVLSAGIGLAALLDRLTKPMLTLSVMIALFYFVIGQGMGGILTGEGTDPGSGPLLILLAAPLCPTKGAPWPKRDLPFRPSRGRRRRKRFRPPRMHGTLATRSGSQVHTPSTPYGATATNSSRGATRSSRS